MDFNVIRRPKPPPKKPDAPPPKPPPPQQALPPPPPPPRPHPFGPFEPYMDELNRMEHLRSVEFSNSRMWKLNYGEYPNQPFGSYEYSHIPVGGFGGGAHNNNDHHRQRPPHMAPQPPHDHHHALQGPPPPPLGLPGPAMDRHHGPPPPGYHYGPPPPNMQHYCHMFSDENPTGCMIM